MFNYIIIAHNAKQHLEEMLYSLFKCKTKKNKVFIVLNGCTDNSKEIAEKFDLTIFETPDIKETLGINHALKNIEQVGFNIILQDDVFLIDESIEDKILTLYSKVKNVGVVGMSHGCNLKEDTLSSEDPTSETDLIKSEFRDLLPHIKPLEKDHFSFRQIVYKSPIVISSELYGKLGGYDERFAPIAHEDTEYCIRSIMAGYNNLLWAANLDHRVKYGATRKIPGYDKYSLHYHKEHMNLLKRLYPKEIEFLSKNHPSLENYSLN